MEEPSEEAVEEPVHSEEDAREANAWATKELTSLSIVSIAILLLLVAGMMLSTGLLELSVLGVDGFGWVLFAGLVLATLGLLVWSRRGV